MAAKKVIDPALEALQNIVKKPVDLDIESAYKAARDAALSRARQSGIPDEVLAERFGVRGDWGFIPVSETLGGKYGFPVEVTAGSLRKAAREKDIESLKNYNRIFLDKINALQTKKKYRPVLGYFETIAIPPHKVGAKIQNAPSTKAGEAYFATFGPAEDAGIPREWMGRVMKSIPARIEPQNVPAPVYAQFMRKVSNHLMNLTDTQREAYLTALQRWNPNDLDNLLELVVSGVQ